MSGIIDSAMQDATALLNRRAGLIDGLRELADFIERTPDAPIALMPVVRLHVDYDEYDAAAALIGAQTTVRRGGYDVAERRFGSVFYGIQRKTGDA